jgi:hypothetical protein
VGNGLFKGLHVSGFEQSLDGMIDDLTGRFARHHQAGLDLPQFDGIGYLHHAV